jgi:hypothetical protein
VLITGQKVALLIIRYEFYRGDIIPPAPKWRASRAVPSGLAARLVLKGRELSARDLSAGCGRDDEGRVASKISDSYPDLATPKKLRKTLSMPSETLKNSLLRLNSSSQIVEPGMLLIKSSDKTLVMIMLKAYLLTHLDRLLHQLFRYLTENRLKALLIQRLHCSLPIAPRNLQ